MREFVIGSMCFVFGIGVMGLLCDWIFVESQRCLDEAKKLHEDALTAALEGPRD
jgi:hypothetical protein